VDGGDYYKHGGIARYWFVAIEWATDPEVRSHCRFASPFILFIPDSRPRDSVPCRKAGLHAGKTEGLLGIGVRPTTRRGASPGRGKSPARARSPGRGVTTKELHYDRKKPQKGMPWGGFGGLVCVRDIALAESLCAAGRALPPGTFRLY
jgi:hypothetical protein